MKETVEFRVPEENASAFLPPGVGKRLSWIRKVELPRRDPLVEQIGRLQHEFDKSGKAFFHGWRVLRKYTQRELREATLVHVWPTKVFEPAGEECGTLYDESTACSECGAGAVQTSPLILDIGRIPRGVDFAQTIAGEIVVTAGVREVFARNKLTGAEFGPVIEQGPRNSRQERFFQLRIQGPPLDLGAATRVGKDIFDESAYGRCPRGHVAGLNLLSEVHVRAPASASDALTTKQLIGVRRGLLRPRPILLLSPRAWRAVADEQLKGLSVEVAHVS